MPKKTGELVSAGTLRKTMLDETNANSYIQDKRSPERDYYRLENRDKQLRAIGSLSPAERDYVLGRAQTQREDTEAQRTADITALTNVVTKLHEKDLIELRALIYLQSLPDTSPELAQLRIQTGKQMREEIAEYIADIQMKKLVMSQVEKITSPDALNRVYATTIQRGPQAFAGLWAAGRN